jgi:hypothetical protein
VGVLSSAHTALSAVTGGPSSPAAALLLKATQAAVDGAIALAGGHTKAAVKATAAISALAAWFPRHYHVPAGGVRVASVQQQEK